MANSMTKCMHRLCLPSVMHIVISEWLVLGDVFVFLQFLLLSHGPTVYCRSRKAEKRVTLKRRSNSNVHPFLTTRLLWPPRTVGEVQLPQLKPYLQPERPSPVSRQVVVPFGFDMFFSHYMNTYPNSCQP